MFEEGGKTSQFQTNKTELEVFPDLSTIKQTSKLYYLPKSSRHPALDSVCNGKAFQMTIADTHPVFYHTLKTLKDTLRVSTLQLIFVVPSEKFDGFKKQTYHTIAGKSMKKKVQDIEQYVLCMEVKSDLVVP